MEERYSVRSFSDRKVEKEKVDAILRAAQLEPVAVLSMGYASGQGVPSPRHSVRKDLSETVFFESFEL